MQFKAGLSRTLLDNSHKRISQDMSFLESTDLGGYEDLVPTLHRTLTTLDNVALALGHLMDELEQQVR
jgi:hypothetical protein